MDAMPLDGSGFDATNSASDALNANETLSDTLANPDANPNLDGSADATDTSAVDAPTNCYGIFASPVMYISTSSADLLRVDVDTHAVSLIGNTVQTCVDIAYHRSNRLVCSNWSSLYWIDPLTGGATLIGVPSAGGETLIPGNSMVGATDGWVYFNAYSSSRMSNVIARVRPESLTSAEIVYNTATYSGLGDLLFSFGTLYFAASGAVGPVLISFETGVPVEIGPLPNSTYGIGNRADGRAYVAAGDNVYDLNLMTSAISNPRPLGGHVAFGLAMQDEGCASQSPW